MKRDFVISTELDLAIKISDEYSRVESSETTLQDGYVALIAATLSIETFLSESGSYIGAAFLIYLISAHKANKEIKDRNKFQEFQATKVTIRN